VGPALYLLREKKAKGEMKFEEKDSSLMQVRAVTAFIVLGKDSTTWKDIIVSAATFNSAVATEMNKQSYVVQTLRIVTNAFGEYLDLTSQETALAGMAVLKDILSSPSMPKIRIRFAIGAATSAEELLLVPKLIAEYNDLANVCVNITVDKLGVPDVAMCNAASDCVRMLAENTPNGEGNFNFTANFNCPPLIPYFPAGYNTDKRVFCLGLEYPDLLVSILKQQQEQCRALQRQQQQPITGEVDWNKAFDAMLSSVQAHVDIITSTAEKVGSLYNMDFGGLDSSPAPRKDIHSMCEVFQLLGTEFGGAGTLRACSYLTKLFKAVKGPPLIGFSGLMLTCLEDSGMAEAAANGQYNVTMLNAYSAVCGIGLDCVPVPGDTPRATLAQLMGDTGTLAFRLNKPLTVRLFPCPGLKAGELTKFTSPDLCNCTVFAVSQ